MTPSRSESAVRTAPRLRAYPTEVVECGSCDGLGERLDVWPDPLGWNDARCTSCWGTGTVEVCANCLDDWDGCSVCDSLTPPASRA